MILDNLLKFTFKISNTLFFETSIELILLYDSDSLLRFILFFTSISDILFLSNLRFESLMLFLTSILVNELLIKDNKDKEFIVPFEILTLTAWKENL